MNLAQVVAPVHPRRPAHPPPVTSNDVSRSTRGVTFASSLNCTRNVNVVPSCSAGTPSNAAVSGGCGGPDTITEGEFERRRPSGVQIAAEAEQSSVAASDTVTSPEERGRTVIVQRWFWFCATRFAPATLPLVAVSASSLSFLYGRHPGKSSLNRSSKLNSLPLPPCSAGTSRNDAVNSSRTAARRRDDLAVHERDAEAVGRPGAQSGNVRRRVGGELRHAAPGLIRLLLLHFAPDLIRRHLRYPRGLFGLRPRKVNRRLRRVRRRQAGGGLLKFLITRPGHDLGIGVAGVGDEPDAEGKR